MTRMEKKKQVYWSTTVHQHKLEGRHRTALIMAPSASQLDDMGLSPTVRGDEIVPSNGYARRLTLQNAIKATAHSDMPSRDDFFNTKVQVHRQAARCNMPIQIVTCSATIQGAGANGANVVLAGETYLMKKEGTEWIQKNLTWSSGQTKDTKELNLASLPDGY